MGASFSKSDEICIVYEISYCVLPHLAFMFNVMMFAIPTEAVSTALGLKLTARSAEPDVAYPDTCGAVYEKAEVASYL